MLMLKSIFNSEKFLILCELSCYIITLLFIFMLYTCPFLVLYLFPYLQDQSNIIYILSICYEYIKLYLIITILSFFGFLPRTLIRSIVYWLIFLSFFYFLIFFIFLHYIYIYMNILFISFIYLFIFIIIFMLIQFLFSLSYYKESIEWKNLLIKQRKIIQIKKSRLIHFIIKPWKKIKVIKTITFRRKN